MTRTALTDNTGRWFDMDKAEKINEATYWDGQNWVSKATGIPCTHECLFRTKSGTWILNHYSDFQGSKESYNEITNEEAAAWLAKQGIEPHSDCEQEYAALEIK